MELKVFSGSANRALSERVCNELGIGLGEAHLGRFSDGEISVEIRENVRGRDVFIIQPTSFPANDHLMELLIMIDAAKRASAQRITAVMPYYGYSRQDRKVAPRAPISAKLVADLLTAAGTNRVLSLDLHAGQIQGFFNIPFDHVYCAPVILEYLKRATDGNDVVIVAPDAGGAERARYYAKRLNANLAVIDKRRERANVSTIVRIIGDVSNKTAILIDDIIDTAGTMTQAVPALLKEGATEVYGAASHAVLSGPAIKRISESQFKTLAVTDTIPLTKEAKALKNIEVLSTAKLLAEAIKRIHDSDSISSLFV